MKYNMVKCDECGKERRSGGYPLWLHLEPLKPEFVNLNNLNLYMQGGLLSGDSGERDFCSPECLLKHAEKLVERAKK